MRKVLVAGATGYLGKFVVREFKRQGYWVRALATMRSGSFSLNQGLAVEAEGAPSMVSESYRVGGIVMYWHSLPLVLKRYT